MVEVKLQIPHGARGVCRSQCIDPRLVWALSTRLFLYLPPAGHSHWSTQTCIDVFATIPAYISVSFNSVCPLQTSDRSSPLSLRPGDPIRQTENRATRCKVERLQLLMQQKRLRRKARRDQRAPYQWLPNRKAGRSNSNSSMSSEGSLDLDFDDSVWKPDVKADLKSEFVMAWTIRTAGSCGMDSNGCAKRGDLPRDTFWGSGSAPSVSKGVLCDEEMRDRLAAGNMKQKPRLPRRP